jgi:hypothetical protein
MTPLYTSKTKAPLIALLIGLLCLPAWAAGGGVAGRVTGVEVSRESAMYKIAVLTLEGPSAGSCVVDGYSVVWSGGRAEARGLSLTVAAGKTAERRFKITPADGDLDRLEVGSAGVAVSAVCK